MPFTLRYHPAVRDDDLPLIDRKSKDRIGDIRHPQLVRGRREEVPIHQIRDDLHLLPADRRPAPLAAADTLQSGQSHQAGHPLSADPKPLIDQLGMDPGYSLGGRGTVMNRPDPLQQRCIGHGPRRGRPMLPRVISAGGDAQQTAHRGD